MNAKLRLQLLFGFILLSLLSYTIWASAQQPIWQWTGLTRRPDNLWTAATLIDAYYGFTTFYVWVLYKERRALPRIAWFIAIMLLGNIAMAGYVLLQLGHVAPGEPVSNVLMARNAGAASKIR
jgi:hypothetical protein